MHGGKQFTSWRYSPRYSGLDAHPQNILGKICFFLQSPRSRLFNTSLSFCPLVSFHSFSMSEFKFVGMSREQLSSIVIHVCIRYLVSWRNVGAGWVWCQAWHSRTGGVVTRTRPLKARYLEPTKNGRQGAVNEIALVPDMPAVGRGCQIPQLLQQVQIFSRSGRTRKYLGKKKKNPESRSVGNSNWV